MSVQLAQTVIFTTARPMGAYPVRWEPSLLVLRPSWCAVHVHRVRFNQPREPQLASLVHLARTKRKPANRIATTVKWASMRQVWVPPYARIAQPQSILDLPSPLRAQAVKREATKVILAFMHAQAVSRGATQVTLRPSTCALFAVPAAFKTSRGKRLVLFVLLAGFKL